jgi:hypothetical protein
MAAGQDQAWAASGEAIGTARKPPYPPDHQTAQGAKRVTTSWLFVVFGEAQVMAQLIVKRGLISPLIHKDFPVRHPLLARGNFASVHLNHQK